MKILLLDELRYESDGSLWWSVQNKNRTRDLSKPVGHGLKHGGYLKVKLGGKAELVHRVIYAKHYGEIPQDMDVDHIDNNRMNNRIENLQLLSRADNVRKAMRQGSHSNPEKRVVGTCLDTGSTISFRSLAQADVCGFNQPNISQCLRGIRPACHSFSWSYA